jgi:hypothetical protein
VEKLETVLKPPEEPYVGLGVRRTEAAWRRIEPLLEGEEPTQLAAALLQRSFGRLLWAADRMCGINSFPVRLQLAWPAALAKFLEHTPADLRPEVLANLQDERNGRLDSWLVYLACSPSALPDGTPQDVVRQLLQVYLGEEAGEVDNFLAACDACGLVRPQRRSPPLTEWKLAEGCSPDERPLRYSFDPEWFPTCPACGGAAFAWAHLKHDGFPSLAEPGGAAAGKGGARPDQSAGPHPGPNGPAGAAAAD